MIVRWSGKVPAQKTSDAPWYFADLMPTVANIAQIAPPDDIDGISILPLLLARAQDTSDRFLYWEFFERGFQQAVRWRNYKAIRPGQGQPLLLFDLSKDIGETHNVSAEHPDIVARIEKYLKSARTESTNWPT